MTECENPSSPRLPGCCVRLAPKGLQNGYSSMKQVQELFQHLFHRSSELQVLSPGRVNLIGEHTDYNQGFVLPAAIDKHISVALAANDSRECRVHAAHFSETRHFSLDELAPGTPSQAWINYIIGVVYYLQQQGHAVEGFDAVLDGNIPVGSGLSSSAAVEGAFSFGLSQLFGLKLERMDQALIGQQSEHHFVGVKCGIMDQFANLHGKKSQLMRLDCRDLSYTYVPFDFPDYRIVLCNTLVSHSLASSEYNQRRQQCEEGVKLLSRWYPGIGSLRDLSSAQLRGHQAELPETVYRRCLYVTEENERVLAACDSLEAGDLRQFGRFMYGSHEGLSRLYEVSCPELDFLVDQVRGREDVMGARMMGGGFGGCTINIVRADSLEAFCGHINAAYENAYGKIPEIYITSIEQGTHLL